MQLSNGLNLQIIVFQNYFGHQLQLPPGETFLFFKSFMIELHLDLGNTLCFHQVILEAIRCLFEQFH